MEKQCCDCGASNKIYHLYKNGNHLICLNCIEIENMKRKEVNNVK